MFIVGGVSLADVYRGLRLRIPLQNWLDPLRTGQPSPFLRPNLFAHPTVLELRQGWQNLGGVRLVNVLNAQQTGFPQLTSQELKELFGGPYLFNLAPSYLTSMRANVARQMPYVNLQAWHANHEQPNAYLPGWVFDQQLPPRNWFATWPGSSAPNTQPWEPVRILCLPRIPSRYRANCDHVVLVAYVPVQLPLRTPTVGLSSPNLQRVKMYCCGPR